MTEELNLSEMFTKLVKFISRNSKLLIYFVGIGVMIVLSYYILIRKPHYVSNAICTSQISMFQQKNEFQRPAIDLINYLQDFVDLKDFQSLGDLLGVEDEIARKIMYIEAEQLFQEDLNELYTPLDKFKLTVILSSDKYYKEISDGFVHYFNNNNYLSNLYSIFSSSKNLLYNDVVNEISAVKARRTIDDSNHDRDFINTEVINSQAVNEVYFLSKAREDIMVKIKSAKLFSYVQGFSNVNFPTNDILLWLILSGIISFIFGMFTALIKEMK